MFLARTSQGRMACSRRDGFGPLRAVGPRRVRDTPISRQGHSRRRDGRGMTGLEPNRRDSSRTSRCGFQTTSPTSFRRAATWTNGQTKCPAGGRTGNGFGLALSVRSTSQSDRETVHDDPGPQGWRPSSSDRCLRAAGRLGLRDPQIPVISWNTKSALCDEGEVPTRDPRQASAREDLRRRQGTPPRAAGADCAAGIGAAEKPRRRTRHRLRVIDVRSLVRSTPRPSSARSQGPPLLQRRGKSAAVRLGRGDHVIIADEAFLRSRRPAVRITTRLSAASGRHSRRRILPTVEPYRRSIRKTLNS